MIKMIKDNMRKALLSALCISVFSGCAPSSAGRIPFSIDPDKTLIVYTSHKTDVYSPIIREFEKRTGITVEVHDGGTIEVLEEIKNGADADVMFGGGVETYQGYHDCIEPYQAAEESSIDPQYLAPDGSYTVFSNLPLVFVYNRKLVKSEDAPKKWSDFMNAKWSGKIAYADPHNSGTSITILLAFVLSQKTSQTATITKFSEQMNGECVNSSGDVLPAVESGSSLIGITLEETAKKWDVSHDDVAMVYPEDGTISIPDGSFLVKNCAHSENAKKFIDFTISKDVQKLLVNEMYRRSIRKDTALAADEAEIKYMNFDFAWAAKEQGEVLALWDSVNP